MCFLAIFTMLWNHTLFTELFFLFQDEIAKLGHAKNKLKGDLEQLKDQLEQQREYRREQERRVR